MADNVLFYDPLLVNTETNKVSLEKENRLPRHSLFSPFLSFEAFEKEEKRTN